MNLGAAWDETVAIVRRRAIPLFATAFVLIALPAALLQAAAPVTAPGRLPEPGLWLLLVPVVLAASLIGALAVSRLALRPDESAGAALAAGLARVLPLLGAAMLAGLAGLALIAASVLLVGKAGLPPLLLVPLAVLVFIWVRLILLTPVAALEPGGALVLLRRSWALTSGQFWRLLGLLLVAGILSLVALITAGAVGGIAIRLAAGQPQPGLPALLLVLLVSALPQAAIGGLFSAFLARLYAQRAEPFPGR